jgi:hypothetical protein
VAGLLEHDLGQQCLNDDCGTHQTKIIAYGHGGKFLGSSTIRLREGELGWNGELDGTYRFDNNNIWGPHDGGEFFAYISERGDTDYETYHKVSGPSPQNSAGQEFAHARRVPCPPTGEALAANPTVKAAIKEASQMADQFRDIHGYWIEHGGWIYAKLRTGGVSTYIKPPATSPPFQKDYPYLDGAVGVYLDNPAPASKGWVIAAKFHVHVENDWNPETDGAAADRNKVPGLVGTPDGTIYVGGSYKRGIWNSDLPSRCR